MPFVMTHLCIAYKILCDTPQIKKPGDFMLGALAPDSVHFRDNYNSDMKKISHLCVGDEKWGRATNNKEWLENALAFLEKNKHKNEEDFIYGYCSHIIADIENNIKIWTPFRLENIQALENGLGSIYHNESGEVDYALYLLTQEREEIWNMLEGSMGYDIPGITAAEDIDKMRCSVLHSQYSSRELSDISSNKYVTLSTIQEFVGAEAHYIKNILYNSD